MSVLFNVNDNRRIIGRSYFVDCGVLEKIELAKEICLWRRGGLVCFLCSNAFRVFVFERGKRNDCKVLALRSSLAQRFD